MPCGSVNSIDTLASAVKLSPTCDMRHKGRFNFLRARCSAAFTVIELIVVISTIALLAGLVLPALAKSKSKTHAIVDLDNVGQILQSVQIYSAQNNDFLPH